MNEPSPATQPMRTRSLVLALAAAAILLTATPSSMFAQVRGGTGGFGGGRPSGPGDEALYFHVLNRTSFGPTEESLKEIRALGVDAYLWRQLHPESIDDSALESRLAAELPPVGDITYQWAEMGYAFHLRNAYSERQLEAVMTQFWENHFTTVVAHGNSDVEYQAWSSMERKEDDAFRANALAPFRTLVEISAKSQAMMYFLDNYLNTVRTGNENYARELLELHSLGVDCGYDQFDVEQVARIFTGWTGGYISRTPPNPCTSPGVPPGCDPLHVVEGDFFFNGRAHDTLAKPNPTQSNPRNDVLGTTFPAGGYLSEGLRVLDIVSRHPCTARFISAKLIAAFVMDNPPAELVDRIADVYLDTEGDTREILWAIFKSPEFRDPANFRGKVRTPLEHVTAGIRMARAATAPKAGGWNDYEWPTTYYYVYNLGQQLFDFNIPTGYPEVGTPWISANGFLQRWKFDEQLMFAYPSARAQVWTDPMQTTVRLRLSSADEVIDHFTRHLIGTTVDATRRQLLTDVLVDPVTRLFINDPANNGQNARLREMIEQVLGFPEFNEQ